MPVGRTVFAQLMEHLPLRPFRKRNGAELLRAVLESMSHRDGKPVIVPVTEQQEAA